MFSRGNYSVLQAPIARRRSWNSQIDREMIAGDPHAFAEVEPVGVVAVGDGFEFEGGAAFFAGLVREPVEKSVAVALGTAGRVGDEVGNAHALR